MNNIYESPNANLDTSRSDRASKKLIGVAIATSLIYMVVNIYYTLKFSPDSASVGVSIVGAILACLVWPIIIVGIVSIWKKNRNSRVRVKAFLYATIFFLATNLIAQAVLPKFAEYNKQHNSDSGAVAPPQVR